MPWQVWFCYFPWNVSIYMGKCISRLLCVHSWFWFWLQVQITKFMIASAGTSGKLVQDAILDLGPWHFTSLTIRVVPFGKKQLTPMYRIHPSIHPYMYMYICICIYICIYICLYWYSCLYFYWERYKYILYYTHAYWRTVFLFVGSLMTPLGGSCHAFFVCSLTLQEPEDLAEAWALRQLEVGLHRRRTGQQARHGTAGISAIPKS